MNANVPASQTRKANVPALVAGGNVAALIPQSLEEAFRVANAIAASGLAPKGLDRPEQILVAIMAGAELGLAPFQSLQSFAVINGKPNIWGDGMLAVVRARGVKVKEWFDNDDEPTKAFCLVTRPDTGEETERTFSLSDAKKANLIGKTGPWQTNQKRMLQMRARAFALRDGCADMLRGIQMREEVEDYQHVRDVTPRGGTGMRARLEARAAEAEVEPNGGFDPQHIEAELEPRSEVADAVFEEPSEAAVVEANVAEAMGATEPADDFPGDRPSAPKAAEPAKATIAERCAAFERRMGEATNPTKLKSIRRAADNLFDDMDASDPEGRVELAFRYEARLAELEDAERAAADQ